MQFDPAHLLRRVMDPFDPTSRFYWPVVIAVGAAIVANTIWYYWRPKDEQPSPTEEALRPWIYWINIVFCIWYFVLLIAKTTFIAFLISFAVNIAVVVVMYAYWLPPRDAAWEREVRRMKYIPEGERPKRWRRRR